MLSDLHCDENANGLLEKQALELYWKWLQLKGLKTAVYSKHVL